MFASFQFILVLSLLAQIPWVSEDEATKTLHFSQNMPPGVDMHLEKASSVDAEIPLEVDDIALAATRTPSLGDWIVSRGICPNEHTKCQLIIRLSLIIGTDTLTKKEQYFARYLARSADGAHFAEGFCRATSSDLKDHFYWQRKEGFWIPTLDEQEKFREYAHFAGMIAVMREMQRRNEQEPRKPATRPDSKLGPVQS